MHIAPGTLRVLVLPSTTTPDAVRKAADSKALEPKAADAKESDSKAAESEAVLEPKASKSKGAEPKVGEPKGIELAWEYDLVITCFQRLSNELRDGRASKRSPLMQVCVSLLLAARVFRPRLPSKCSRVKIPYNSVCILIIKKTGREFLISVYFLHLIILHFHLSEPIPDRQNGAMSALGLGGVFICFLDLSQPAVWSCLNSP